MLNLKEKISDYSLFISNCLNSPLINLINEEIYVNSDSWSAGPIADGMNSDVRSVKVSGFEEQHIGTSVSKRVIFNELKKFVPRIEEAYRKNISEYYFSDKNYFQFLYYDDKMKGHYTYHTDNCYTKPRNLTILIGLNSKDQYEGGELFIGNDKNGIKLDRGDMVCFPSNFMYPHKVQRVTQGQRKVLIIWTQ